METQPPQQYASGITDETCLVLLFLSILTLFGLGSEFSKILLVGFVIFIIYLISKIKDLPAQDYEEEEYVEITNSEKPMAPYMP